MPTDEQPCPWCREKAGYRALSPSESSRLARRIFWQSFVLSATDIVRHPLSYVPALIGAKGREICCQRCARLVRICPGCDATHRWLNAGLLTCTCGTSFL